MQYNSKISIYSNEDYYPTPSQNVISYKMPSLTQTRRAVIKADVYALIVYLTSPMDSVDYNIFSDFFLIYRNFLSSMELYDLLISRFKWCINEIVVNFQKDFEGIDERYHPRKIGEVALIRTFVLLRHWILNYFINDFLPNSDLRRRFIKFLNLSINETYPKIINSSVISLKKSWIMNCKKTWDKLQFNEPGNIGQDDEWLIYIVKDITQLEEEEKRFSRLSNYALQEMSDPDARNKNVLSTYRTSDVFRLPLNDNIDVNSKFQKRTIKQSKNPRTGSMVLFPQDNLSNRFQADTTNTTNDELYSLASHDRFQTLSSSNDNMPQRKVSVLSRITNISSIIKELEYPKSSSLDVIIPPTPSKKVEFILKTNIVSDELLEKNDDELEDHFVDALEDNPEDIQTGSSNVTDIIADNTSEHFSITLSVERDSKEKIDIDEIADTVFKNKKSKSIEDLNIGENASDINGPIGLLSKWKNNHANRAYSQDTVTDNQAVNSTSNSRLELDKFVKYVISISSIGPTQSDSEAILNTIATSFDILSARTIDEVEFLIAIENNLIRRMHDRVPSYSANNIDSRNVMSTPVEEYSTVDNLDLYRTVTTIANSVISLTNSLNRLNKHDSSPFKYDNAQRRMVKSSTQVFQSNSVYSNIKMPLKQAFLSSPEFKQNNGPQRLVFKGGQDELHNNNNFTTLPKSSKRTSIAFKKNTPLSSPLKNMTIDLKDDSVENQTKNSTMSSISYDSMLSLSTQKSENDSKTGSEQDLKLLKKKSAKNNLRENFTFEQNSPVSSKIGSISSNKSTASRINSLTESKTSMSLLEKQKKYETYTAIRPSSGRISIVKRNSLPLYHRKVTTVDLETLIAEDAEYQEMDKKLNELELSGFDEISIAGSEVNSVHSKSVINPSNVSIETSQLMDENSKLQEFQAYNNGNNLSNVPSIHSIETNNSLETTLESVEDGNGNSKKRFSASNVNKSLREQFLNDKVPDMKQENNANFLGLKNSYDTNSFNESPAKISKYVYSTDNETNSNASPDKNIDNIKERFLNFEGNNELSDSSLKKDESEMDFKKIDDDNGDDVADDEIFPKGLEAISKLPDDSIYDDPLAIALMKLEGTFTKSENPVTGVSGDILRKTGISVSTRSAKRNSMFFEKRRNTIMNIPFTPESKKDITYEEQDIGSITPDKIQELFQQYTLEDPRLMISNKSHHIPFILMYESISIAEQLTLIEKELLKEVDWEELLNLKVVHEGIPVNSWLQLLIQNETLSGIDLVISRFNLTVDWIISEISLTTNTKLKRNTIQRFIHVAEHCKNLQNYNTLLEIVLALNSSKVQSYREAWRLIEPGDILSWQSLQTIPSLDSNYSSIRQLLNDVDPIRGCIPFIVVYLSDLSLNSEKRDWIVENQVVNYNKFETNVQIVKNFIQRVQWSKFYDLKVNEELLSKCVYIASLTKDELELLE
ncbi:hypothetical protein TPHA_0L00420 [Tetrapisispora phaffii CBS 4417]|uniref:Guanine nucleotide exchange factor LTE1 n=1 Tax=Tetrapisispora phaffii (strain ATCC 24235 / CBS 4417 / NBRC 1672 / NRRL Y-8282 / UCD 70-5) TaxID=1071381 RepID=G8BZS0_TETPH|nr:hypothetical protein TPHA_0L00420 [Tetrapisispora phaffii CBS 4417]CCE65398.1 hypothetical protein TPHA_0L00420 [Tetrapisispora phaffii CBS 4417]